MANRVGMVVAMRRVQELPEIASTVRRLRRRAGLTQEMLAERAGLGTRSIQGLERGERRPHSETIRRLVDALGLAGLERAQFEAEARLSQRPGDPDLESGGRSTTLIEHPQTSDGRAELPVLLTSFIGREREVAEITRRVVSCRLLTLTGPPGVGKTRLALQVARDLTDEYDGGVRFVPLAAVRDSDHLLSEISKSLGVDGTERTHLVARFGEVLRDRRFLLVLDNFEQVAPAATLVSQLLEASPLLTVLVTSRSRLRLRGEREFVVPPLMLPDDSYRYEPEEGSDSLLAGSEAVRLFVERAREAGSTLDFDSDSLVAIAKLCRKLEGLPLSIELAAAWSKFFAPPALLKRLDNRLSLLTAGSLDLPERQQTVRQAIGWSYDLLGSEEQALFRQVAVFVDGFTFEAAAAVADATVESLTTLVDKSLVDVVRRGARGTDSEPRFRMLETIRDYAWEQLAASGELMSVQSRHGTYFLSLAEAAARSPEPEHLTFLDLVEREHENLLAVMRFFLDQHEAEPALRLGSALQWFWSLRCYVGDAQPWLAELGALARSLARPREEAQVLRSLGRVAYQQCGYATARALFGEGLSLSRQIGDNRGVAEALAYLGLIVRGQGDYCQAQSLSQESLEIYREIGDEGEVGAQLDRVGISVFYLGNTALARSLLDESLRLRRKVGDPIFLAWSLYLLGQVAHHEADYPTARRRFEESIDLWRPRHYDTGIVTALASLGDLAIDEGNPTSARTLLIDSIQRSYVAGDWAIVAGALESLGGLAAVREAPERAFRLVGAAASLRKASGDVCPPDAAARLARRLARARQILGDERSDAALSEGRALQPSEAIAYAKEWPAAAG